MPATESDSGKCFSGILRCLLCKGSLPTHPSDDHFTLSNMKDEAKYHLKQAYERSLGAAENVYNAKKPLASSQSPGLVARLMGLESLPDTRDRSLGSILRSRSVNSIDFLSHLDFQKQETCLNQHRRVRTSVSFRDDDYYSIVLQLEEELVDENDLREDEQQIKNKARLNGHEEKKEKQKKRTRKLNNGACVKQSSGDGDVVESQRENVCERPSPRLRERRKNIPVNSPKKEALNGSSKFVKSEKNKIVAHKVHSGRSLKKVYPEDAVRDAEFVKKPRSRRASTPEIARSKKSSCSRSLHSDNGESRAFIEGKAEKRKMAKIEEKCYYGRIVEVICKLTEESLDKTWMMMHGDGAVLKLEDTEEISRQLEEDILEDLLTQFVDEEVVITF